MDPNVVKDCFEHLICELEAWIFANSQLGQTAKRIKAAYDELEAAEQAHAKVFAQRELLARTIRGRLPDGRLLLDGLDGLESQEDPAELPDLARRAG